MDKEVATGADLLIVDDNVDGADALGDMASLMGFDAMVVYNVADALRQIAQTKPRGVLLDVNMPGMDGLDFAIHLRAAHGHSILLIAVTGAGIEDSRAAQTFSIVDHHLLKPVDIDVLERLLRDHLKPAAESST